VSILGIPVVSCPVIASISQIRCYLIETQWEHIGEGRCEILILYLHYFCRYGDIKMKIVLVMLTSNVT